MTYIDSSYVKHYIVGLSADKDLDSCLKTVIKYASREYLNNVYLVKASSSSRAASVEVLEEKFQHLLKDEGITILNPVSKGSVYEALEKIKLKIAKNTNEYKNNVIVICGSFYIMAEGRDAIGIR